jgi:hypothetical protein
MVTKDNGTVSTDCKSVLSKGKLGLPQSWRESEFLRIGKFGRITVSVTSFDNIFYRRI